MIEHIEKSYECSLCNRLHPTPDKALECEKKHLARNNRADRITVKQAADLMGVSQQFIRIGLQRGILPFGQAIQLSHKQYTYYISPKLFKEYTGEEVKA